MAVAAAKRKLNYADFERIPEDGQRHEIIDGEHYVSPPPAIGHQKVVRNLLLLLGNYTVETGRGDVLQSPVGVVLSDNDVFEPDLIFVAAGREHLLQGKNFAGAPDLVVEVLSPGTRRRDQNLKRKRYELLGVGECWMVDPVAQMVTILRRNAESAQFDEVAQVSSGSFRTPFVPGLEVGLSKILRS